MPILDQNTNVAAVLAKDPVHICNWLANASLLQFGCSCPSFQLFTSKAWLTMGHSATRNLG